MRKQIKKTTVRRTLRNYIQVKLINKPFRLGLHELINIVINFNPNRLRSVFLSRSWSSDKLSLQGVPHLRTDRILHYKSNSFPYSFKQKKWKEVAWGESRVCVLLTKRCFHGRGCHPKDEVSKVLDVQNERPPVFLTIFLRLT